MSQLTIYKASAGSGKTFTLSRNFLLLLFQEKDNYKHILAATFTNKATEEMKSRIISELHTLAKGHESAHRSYLLKHLPFIKSEEELNRRAQHTLSNILHDYSHLSITTIDRFFQKIIRSFAREMHVSSNYSIELDDKAVLQKVSEQLFFDLEKKGNEDLVNWMTSFAEEQIENGNSWNFSESIGKLSQEFLSEDYKRASSKNEKALGDFIVLKSFLSKITKHQMQIKDELKSTAQRGVSIAESHSLVATDFKYGKSSGINFLYQTASGNIPEKLGARTLDMLENQEAYYTKTAKQKEEIIAACNAGLTDSLLLTVQKWKQLFPMYQSIELIRANFYSLGILSDLERQLKNYTDDNNILLLSNSNELIANIIADSDTPFIYEKTGSSYRHFMIDEFQDTSQLQWSNLKPLISNSLGEGNENLIVGDVKQSIYRWRNSDWKQLDHGIRNEFTSRAHEEVLPTNWRSHEGIIRFNNTLISTTAKHLQERFISEMDSEEASDAAQLFESAYADIIQQVPDKAPQGGFVSMQFYHKDNNDNWQEDTIEKLPGIIEQAQDRGYQLSDIAILVRRNTEGAQISRYLLNYAATHPDSKYNYNVISDEALWVSGSYDVQFLINIFKYIVQPGSIVSSQLNMLYSNYLSEKTQGNKLIWNSSILHPDIVEKLKNLTSLSLLESTEELISRFQLGSEASEAIFIQSFIDIVNDFEYQQSGGINEFLTWWDESGKTRSVSTPEGQDAINILTVHKSKGLEYKIVIVPFLDWEIAKDKGYLWTTTTEEPLNEIPYLPVRLSSKLKKSLFKKEYEGEKLLQYIDSLNLLYVAFTRAKVALYAFGDSSRKGNLDAILTEVLGQSPKESSTTIDMAAYWDTERLTFCYGELPVQNKQPQVDSGLMLLKKYSCNQQNQKLQLRLQSHDFEITDNKINPTASKTGKIWHRLFEEINSLNELPDAINQLMQEGVVSANAAEELQINIKSATQHPKVTRWFSPEAKLRKEAAILTPEGHNYRPDRVVEFNGEISVIDFKFGSAEKNSYHKQVGRYVQLIRQMGKEKVKGYLWYVRLGKVVAIGDKVEQLTMDL